MNKKIFIIRIFCGKLNLLNHSKPFNVTLAEGSAVKVSTAEKL